MTVQYDFSGKTALVTGASRGIGRTIAQMLAGAGARVVVHYGANQTAAEATLASLAGDGHITLQADLGRTDETIALADAAIARLGRIDILVNNAGIFLDHPIASADWTDWEAAWRRVIDVNLIGAAHLTFAVARHMIEHGGGRVVNVSSRGAFRGEPDAPAYGASKAGMNAMGQSLAKALAPHNVFVHTVAPGFVETDMAKEHLTGESGRAIRAQSPLNRVATPEEVAQAVLFCAAEETAFLTGCIIDVNGASYLRT